MSGRSDVFLFVFPILKQNYASKQVFFFFFFLLFKISFPPFSNDLFEALWVAYNPNEIKTSKNLVELFKKFHMHMELPTAVTDIESPDTGIPFSLFFPSLHISNHFLPAQLPACQKTPLNSMVCTPFLLPTKLKASVSPSTMPTKFLLENPFATPLLISHRPPCFTSARLG